AVEGWEDRAAGRRGAGLSSPAAVAWTRPMKAPCPPPTSPMRSFRFSGALVGMDVVSCGKPNETQHNGGPTAAAHGPGAGAGEVTSPQAAGTRGWGQRPSAGTRS